MTTGNDKSAASIRCFNPAHEKAWGLRPALFLSQLHFWTERSKHRINGKRWVYNTHKDWTSEENFPNWSPMTIRRIIYKLVKAGVVKKSNRMNKSKSDWTTWLAINYDHPILQQFPLINTKKTPDQNEQQRMKAPVQNDQQGCSFCSHLTRNNSETTESEISSDPRTDENPKIFDQGRETMTREEHIFDGPISDLDLEQKPGDQNEQPLDWTYHQSLLELHESKNSDAREICKFIVSRGERFAMLLSREVERRIDSVKKPIDNYFGYRLKIYQDIIQNPKKGDNAKFSESFEREENLSKIRKRKYGGYEVSTQGNSGLRVVKRTMSKKLAALIPNQADIDAEYAEQYYQ